MNRFTDRAFGSVLSGLGSLAITSWGTYQTLFAPCLMGKPRSWLSERRARAVFWNAQRQVPAYNTFLAEHGAQRPRRFEDIPVMHKDNYIRRFALEQLCQGGSFPRRGAVLDESSGSSGSATTWVRGPQERHATRRLIQYSARATFGERSFVLLNAFALGPWATGMNVSMSLVDRCIVKSIGPDAQKLLATLKSMGPSYRYLITGYPPFLRNFVAHADLEWAAYDICAVVGGEGMSEEVRAVLDGCFKKTISSFGASDLEINLAVESEFSVAVRQAARADSSLARALFGANTGLPMIFQYDPLNMHIETSASGSLLFTLNRLENVSPRIRYDLRDRGLVRSMQQVDQILREHRVELPAFARPPLGLPLLFHWGREDHAIAFYGCKITPEDVQQALARVPAFAHAREYALHPYELDARKRLEIWIELPGESAPAPCAETVNALLAALAAVNQDFRESLRMLDAESRPSVKLFARGQSPMSAQDARIKKKYIM